jgi:16S rRNA (guanine527-N7)-methyltransferase
VSADHAPIEATLERFAALVAASPHNLVSRSARAELLSRHVPESVALARLLPAGALRLLDIGSGGGFPGIVIAAVRPDIDVHLMDATAKKTTFLAEAAASLGLRVEVHTGRAEALRNGPLVGSFDVVTARAVAPIARLLPLALPFLRPTGVLYAVKGDRWREELDLATPELATHGARVLATPDDLGATADAGPDTPRVVLFGRIG